jgi:hypothetical protein
MESKYSYYISLPWNNNSSICVGCILEIEKDKLEKFSIRKDNNKFEVKRGNILFGRIINGHEHCNNSNCECHFSGGQLFRSLTKDELFIEVL